eukprot:8115517-Heterocapsa_arctica.AAC.1
MKSESHNVKNCSRAPSFPLKTIFEVEEQDTLTAGQQITRFGMLVHDEYDLLSWLTVVRGHICCPNSARGLAREQRTFALLQNSFLRMISV